MIKPESKKWLLLILVIKILLFCFFASNYKQNRKPEKIVGGIAVISGDTPSYFRPMEDFISGNGYTSICRMPGLLPAYSPLGYLFGKENGKVLLVILQLLTAVISVYLLSLLAYDIFGSTRAFLFTLIAYSLSTFVSVWDNNLLTDSFAASFAIIGFYLLYMSQQTANRSLVLIISSCFLTWAIFLRPINVLLYFVAFACIFVWKIKKETFISIAKQCMVFTTPLLVAISVWAGYNYTKTKRFIPLTASFGECFNALSPEHLEIRKLIIAMGEDFQPWAPHSAAEWFYTEKANQKTHHPFTSSTYTTAFNLDSLILLKENYRLFSETKETNKQIASSRIFNAVDRYLTSYKKEHAFDYYILNRIKLVTKFIFRTRLDDLPFPKLADMKLYQKLIKAGSLIALNLVNLFGLLSIIFLVIKRQWNIAVWGFLPLSFIIVLGAILGYIEQRYLVPCYPFMLLLINYLLPGISNWKNITG